MLTFIKKLFFLVLSFFLLLVAFDWLRSRCGALLCKTAAGKKNGSLS